MTLIRAEFRFIGTRNAQMLVDHVGDLSSSNESIVFLGLMLFQRDLLLEVRVRQRLLEAVATLASSISKLGFCFPVVE